MTGEHTARNRVGGPVGRAVAVVAAAAGVGGAVAASVAQRAGPTADLISALGVKGRPLAKAFRAGQGLVAAASVARGVSAVAAAPHRQASTAEDRPAEGWRHLLLHGEPRGAALAATGCLLAITATVPCSPGCPIPLVDGTGMPGRDWIHVPATIAAFYLWPLAAHGRTRTLLLANLAPLIPLTMTRPHGPAVAVLQRTMALLAAAALLTWQPTRHRPPYPRRRRGPVRRHPVGPPYLP